MIKCQSCGVDNPEDSRFCTGCGANLLQPVQTGEAACTRCGAAISGDSKFCVSCGQPVGLSDQAAPAHCTNCGAKLDPDSRFCSGCGSPIGGPPQPAEGPIPLATPGDMTAQLAAYWAVLDSRLAQSGFEKLGQAASLDADRIFKRKRFDLVKGGKVTTLCAAKWVPGTLTPDAVRMYSQAVFNFGSSQKALLGRSFFQPLVVYPVLVSLTCPPDVQAFLNSHWPKHYQAFEFPVVVALSTKELFCHRSTPVWGMAFHAGIKREAESLFQP